MTISFSLYLPDGFAPAYKSLKWFSSHYDRKISQNKSIEWQTDYFGWTNLFSFSLDLIPTGSDHAAVGISATLLGFMVSLRLYDGRHWDSEGRCWEKYDDESNAARERKWRRDHATSALEDDRALLQREGAKNNIMELQDFMQTPKGKAMIDQVVDRQVEARLSEIKKNKQDKQERGEAYRIANIKKAIGDIVK